MQGIELSELFYHAVADELFCDLDDVRARHAAGLVGEGSECFGFDDDISRDHDWGPSFCIWLDADDFQAYGAVFQERYRAISARDFKGFSAREEQPAPPSMRRVGVLSIDAFYESLIRFRGLPSSLDEWRACNESGLAAAVNGRVFFDGAGRFTEIREHLASYYPEDIRLRKIASGCMHAAQAGQYNFVRQSMRGEDVSAFQALAEFVDATMQIAYALAYCYRPFYKWTHKRLRSLGDFEYSLASDLENLVETYRSEGASPACTAAESICSYIASELRVQGLSTCEDTFLVPHAVEVNAHIADDAYRRSDLMSV